MKKKILINALYAEEKRVAIVEGEKLIDFYSEVSGKEQLKGNIYKGVVARIEPGLQAAFVNFGPKKHGFLQVNEVSPEYYTEKIQGRRPRIQEVLSKGQELVVQVEKDERDTKGASLTTYLSIPGRYIVMMPGQERVGVSRKIESREDRDRLKDIFKALKVPKKMGFILRTAGSDCTSEDLSNDLKYLTKLWNRIQTASKKASAPALIYQEHDMALRTVRDYLTSDVDEILVDDKESFRMIKEFLTKTVPWQKVAIRHLREKKPIFSKFNLEDQITKIFDRYVHLPSRGYLVIDKTEAMTVIDVNSGRSRKEENVESTALRTNMEAADEVARQLRLRDIGGLVVIDFIDLESSKNRRSVEKHLRECMSSDKAHVDVGGISKFGIVEMTRERLRPAHLQTAYDKCETCGGTGSIRPADMVAISAFRAIHSAVARGGLKAVKCRLPVESLNHLINARRTEIVTIEKESGVAVNLIGDASLAGQFVLDLEKVPQSEPSQKEAQPKHAPKPPHPTAE